MTVKSAIKRILPARVFLAVRSLPYQLIDLVHPPPAGEIIPPLGRQLDGTRGYELFRSDGPQTVEFYKTEAGLKPESRMLDIGCGVGRQTIPLLKYLTGDCLYVGMDIEERSIKWCSRNISVANPRFVFIALDVYNKFYNPTGRIRPDKLVLPFPDNSFDFVTAWSVFTHMYPIDVTNYLREMCRVLKPGGKTVATFYLINEHAKSEVAAGRADWDVSHYLADTGCWTTNPNIPEDLIGLDEVWVRAAYKEAGLTLVEPIRLGGWANRDYPKELKRVREQDIVIAQKP